MTACVSAHIPSDDILNTSALLFAGKWFVSTGKDNLLNAWRTPYGASIFQVTAVHTQIHDSTPRYRNITVCITSAV